MDSYKTDKVKQRPIRVAIVMGKHITGGIKSVIMSYYNSIDRNTIQFDFLVDSDSPNKNYSDIEKLGGKVYEIAPTRHLFKHIIECRKVLRENDYLIVHGYLNTLNVFSMMAAKMAGVPVRIAENLSTAHPGEPKTKIKNLLKPFSHFFATHIAANSKYAAEWIYGKEQLCKCNIITNALDLEKYQYNAVIREKARNSLDINENFVVGHIGRYHYQKNHDFLINIFYELHKLDPNSKLLLVGYGSLKKTIFEKIKKLNLEDAVIDMGATENIIDLYNAMDVFVLPSFYEGLPVVGIEAQACGLPCIFSDEITHETQITDAVEFMPLSYSALEWAKCILKWKGKLRVPENESITKNGYNIKNAAKDLAEYYITLLPKL